MTQSERNRQIDELTSQTELQSLEKIRLSTELYFLERQSGSDQIRVQAIRVKMAELSTLLAPALNALHALQCRYRVVLRGELTDIHGNKTWNQPDTKVYLLKTDCVIDTDANGWAPYIYDPVVGGLLSELHGHIYRVQYDSWQAISIKRLP